MSIRLRLTLWYSGLLAVTLVAFGVIIYGIVQNNTMSSLKDQLRRISEETQVRMTSQGRMGQGVNLSGVLRSAIDYNSFFIQIVNYTPTITGVVDDKTPNMRPSANRPELTFSFPRQNEVSSDKYAFVNREIEGVPFIVLEKPILYSDTVVGLLQVGAWTGREEQLLHQLRSILWFAGAAGLIAAFLLGMFLSRKALMPINRVTEAAERIQSGSELSLRIPREKPNDEIGRLTDTLNAMLSGVERAYKNLEDSNTAQRRFVSDASHELRTPLTTIRGNVDLLEKIWSSEEEEQPVSVEANTLSAPSASALSETEKRDMSLESIRDIADEARRMSGLVNHLLSLARADAGYVMEMSAVELRPLAEEAARRAAFLPRKAEWAAGPLEALDGVRVRGNRDYLLQLLFILIENGFKYTPSGVVRLYATRRDNAVGLSVADTGIGIAEDEVPHIFERFYRVDVSRGETSGTGLGLSIAKWIADMHHARIEVRTRLSEGTVFTVWLPVQQGDEA